MSDKEIYAAILQTCNFVVLHYIIDGNIVLFTLDYICLTVLIDFRIKILHTIYISELCFFSNPTSLIFSQPLRFIL